MTGIRWAATAAAALAYGTTHTLAGLTCASDEAGITCTDSTTAHNISLSRDANELH
ncbi:hypothetical protein [Mycobacterium sp. DL592]|uniref:hypothetical protein n=1 Tax=Mycobacterium sp. DL592 TaxID=2675524 RepID=UPI00141F92EC|nr:hypothetical protein [Mycobacterium sp. DL592]